MSIVRRSHTSGNIAPAIWRLREQVNAAYPNRSKVSDGIWPSAAHTRASPNSDHEAGNALDITADLGSGAHVRDIYEAIKASGDVRVSYIIHARKIWSPERGERAYNGSNPHTSHMHVSVKESRRGDNRNWTISKEALPVTISPYRIVTAECSTLAARNRVATMCVARNMAHTVLGRSIVFHGSVDRVREIESFIAAETAAKRTHGVIVENGTHTPLNQGPPHGRFTDDESFGDSSEWKDRFEALRKTLKELVSRL